MERNISELSLEEITAERNKILRSIKKMKRNAVLYRTELPTACRRNLLLKDEIHRRKSAVVSEKILVPA